MIFFFLWLYSDIEGLISTLNENIQKEYQSVKNKIESTKNDLQKIEDGLNTHVSISSGRNIILCTDLLFLYEGTISELHEFISKTKNSPLVISCFQRKNSIIKYIFNEEHNLNEIIMCFTISMQMGNIDCAKIMFPYLLDGVDSLVWNCLRFICKGDTPDFFHCHVLKNLMKDNDIRQIIINGKIGDILLYACQIDKFSEAEILIQNGCDVQKSYDRLVEKMYNSNVSVNVIPFLIQNGAKSKVEQPQYAVVK